MQQKILRLLAVISVLCLITPRLQAQVTIGSGIVPNPGSLLDVKSNNNNGPNATGGISFPRVSITSLAPATDATFAASIGGTGSWDRQTHTGLMVYNTSSTVSPLGLHVWNGTRWMPVNSVTAANGLNKNGEVVELGGNLSQTATNIGIDAATQALRFNIANDLPSSDPAHNVNTGVLIPGLQEQANSKVVVADVSTGKLGIATVVPAGLAFYQAASIQQNISTAINAGNEVAATFENGDVEYNNIVTLQNSGASNYYFEFKQAGKYEISASVCYCPRYNSTGTCLLNAYLQISPAGSSTWTDYSAVRGIWSGNTNVYRQTMVIPPVILDVPSAGYKIRLAIQRPPDGSGWLGDNHSDSNTTVNTGILVPYGTRFSKTIKILAVEM